jgi:hypothetical protein
MMDEITEMALNPAMTILPARPSARNSAVQRCADAWHMAIDASQVNHLDQYDTRKRAAEAYRRALPDLSGYENIRDFIASVTYGMILGVFDEVEAPKLLYAAQVATGTLRCAPKPKKEEKQPA